MASNPDCRTKTATLTVASMVVFATAFMPAWASGNFLPLQSYNETIFVTGGVGEEELEDINAARGDFNVQLLMAEKSGAYVAGVRLVVFDAKGGKVLEADGAGPYLLVRLPAGSYHGTADYEGRSMPFRLNVRGGGRQSAVIRW